MIYGNKSARTKDNFRHSYYSCQADDPGEVPVSKTPLEPGGTNPLELPEPKKEPGMVF